MAIDLGDRSNRCVWVVTAVVAILISLTAASGPAAAAPQKAGTRSIPHVIIDTDLSLYWDDVTAVGMANVLQQQHKVKILGIVSDIRNTKAVAAINAIDTAYGHGTIPLGAVVDSEANAVPYGYDNALIRRLPHSIRSSSNVTAAVSLYRRLLASQPDNSVTVVALGAYTNLAGLLRSRPGQGSALDGRALVAAKVRNMVIEDGLFPIGLPGPVTNTKYDVASARAVVSGKGWPTPIAWVDGYTGLGTKVGGMLCSTTPKANPMRIVYQFLFGCGPPKDGDWDGPTMLYAIGGPAKLFSQLGQGGTAVMNAQGGLSWQTVSRRRGDVYVHVIDQQTLNRRIDQLLETR